jgi:hypothetical protein
VDAGLLLLLLLIMLAVGYAVLSPLRHPQDAHDEDARADQLVELEIRKEGKYGEIRDAEADFHAGKLSREDYRGLDRALRQEAVAILAEIDRVTGKAPEDS